MKLASRESFSWLQTGIITDWTSIITDCTSMEKKAQGTNLKIWSFLQLVYPPEIQKTTGDRTSLILAPLLHLSYNRA